jgi:hypothetical protein
LNDTQYILSIDPGVSTGIALLGYNDESVWLEGAWQFSGGLRGFIQWHEGVGSWEVAPLDEPITYIAEKFTARATSGFSYKTDSLEPLRIEGVLVYAEYLPDYTPKEKRWRDPSLQYLVGGKDKADKKKRQHRFLKDSGFYRTGRDLDAPDADDFRSACAHGLSYLARELKHRPTFELISNWSENNGS